MAQDMQMPGQGGGAGSLPSVLGGVRSHALVRLSGLLGAALDRAEAALYDLSRLPGTDEQAALDRIMALKGRRATIEQRFSADLDAAFAALVGKPGGERKSFDQIDFASLSLVHEDEMDITVAVDTMVARARLDCAGALGVLRRRFSSVLKRDCDDALPLDPAILVKAFRGGLDPVELALPQRMTVLRAFQDELLARLGEVYAESNQVLIDAGVLPELKAGVAALGGGPRREPAARASKPERPPVDTSEIMALLQGAVAGSGLPGGGGPAGEGLPGGPGGMPTLPGAQYHGGQYVGGGGIGAVPAAAVGGSVAAVPIVPASIAPTAVVQQVDTSQLVAMLSNLQQNLPKTAPAAEAALPTVAETREAIRDNLRSDDKAVETVRRADEDVINLVSMLFDFILDDDELPTVMKAVIGRLQIPLLKVAIIDKTFFNAESHPARRLLNALSKAGLGWSEGEAGGDALYAKIEEVVFRIVNEFTDNLEIFAELLEEFTAFHEQQERREQVVDKRTREMEEGRARSDLARAMVQQTINRRLIGRQVPVVVVRLLQDAWRNVLNITCLREGAESEAWKQAVKVVDALVWSVLPQQGAAWVEQLRKVSPRLITSLRRGLESVHHDPLATESLLRELAQLHLELIGGDSVGRTVRVVEVEKAGDTPATVEAAQLAASIPEAVEVVALPPAPEPEPPPPIALPKDDPSVELAERLAVGSWVEFVKGEQRERHKLVARIRATDKLIFANRRGIKVAEMTGAALALALSRSEARVVEESAVMERALEGIITSLRQLQPAPAVNPA